MTDWIRVPEPSLKRNYVNRTVRLLRDADTPHGIVPKGSVGRILSQSPGPRRTSVQFPHCGGCNFAPRASGLDHNRHFEFVEEAV